MTVQVFPDIQLSTSLRYDEILLNCPVNATLSDTELDEITETESSPKEARWNNLTFQEFLMQEQALPNELRSPFSPFYMLRLHRDRLLEASKQIAGFSYEITRQALTGFKANLTDRVKVWFDQQHSLDIARGPLKLQVRIDVNGKLKVEINRVDPVILKALYPPSLNFSVYSEPELRNLFRWTVVIDSQHLIQPNLYTSFKTSNRGVYTKARSRHIQDVLSFDKSHADLIIDEFLHSCGHSTVENYSHKDSSLQPTVVNLTREVLLCSHDLLILEGSITTPYIYKPVQQVNTNDTRDHCNSWITPYVKIGKGGQRGTTRRWALNLGKICSESEITLDMVYAGGKYAWLSNGVSGFGIAYVEQKKTL